VNVSPEIEWTGVPAGTQSFAIALHDLAFLQNGDPFTHWVMWNIPGSATGLPANLPRAALPGVPAANTQQVNYLDDDDGFAGSGACGNVYEFVLYALDTATFTPADAGNQNAVQSELDASDAALGTTTMRARSNPDGPCDVVN
jgi:Raf kinase inhibitor-like YbhB/YbcL family protein